MPRYGTYLQKEARDLFENYKEDFKKIEETSIDVIIDDKNNRVVKNIDFITRLKEIKETLEEIMGECEEYEEYEEYDEYEEEDEKHMVFDMDEYHIGDYISEENRNWIYEYEVNEYYTLISKRLCEYDALILEVD